MDNNLPYHPPQQLSEQQQQSEQLSEQQQQHQSERIGGDGGDPTNDDHRSQRSRGRDNERERSPSDDHRIQRTRGGNSPSDDHQRSQRARGGGVRDNERERSRREFETSRDSYARPFRRDRERDYDFDDDYDRPRSRSSYHDEEYYSSLRRRRRGENEYRPPRGPPSEYSSRAYPRDTRPSYGYMDHPSASSRSFGLTQYAPPGPDFYSQGVVNSQTQSFQMYLATFRIQNPAQYREWYNKYLAHKQDPIRIPVPPIPGYVGIPVSRTQIPVGNTSENVSGPSSLADESFGGYGQDSSRFQPITDNPQATPPPSRNTPLLFPTPHAICNISALGHVIRNRYGRPNIEVLSLKQLMKGLPEFKEVKAFPGPLIKGTTHKNTIIQFCQRKMRDLEVNENETQLDGQNLILLWELLILLLRQNGSAIGSDIAELLLKKKSGRSSNSDSEPPLSEDEDQINEETRRGNAINKTGQRYRSNDIDQKCVDIFCKKLIYGHKKEALEYAMDNALWGHALFFAAKMDEKLYGTVLARFANGTMSMSSPLHTLYNVLGGKQPPSVTCCGDESFGDWKPHLAMILSNMGQRPEFEATTMQTLGRTLGNRNLKFAAQFCYLMAETEFSEDSEIGVLLGYDPATHNILEATQMTEIYEFARSLANSDFSLGPAFIERKLNYTKELINLGFIQEAYAYCEQMTKSLKNIRFHSNDRILAQSILYFAERLVNCEPEPKEAVWIESLRKMSDQLESQTTSRKMSETTSLSDHIDDANTNSIPPYNAMEKLSLAPSYGVPDVPINNVSTIPSIPVYTNENNTMYPISGPSQWQGQQNPSQQFVPYINSNQQLDNNNMQPSVPNFQTNGTLSAPSTDNNNYWPPPYEQPPKMNPGISAEQNPALPKKKVVRFEDDFNVQNGLTKPARALRQLDKLQSKMNHLPSQSSGGHGQNKLPMSSKAENKSKPDLKNQKKGWIGGMLSKLAFKAPNQMNLPDDKEPTIVWDPATKTWKNTTGDEDEDSAPKGPPPKDSDMMRRPSFVPAAAPAIPNVPNIQNANNAMPLSNSLPLSINGLPNPQNPNQPNLNNGIPGIPPPGPPNMFQRQKGLKPRNNYVDVWKTNGNPMQKAEEPSVPLPVSTMPMAGSGMPNIFMPPPLPPDSGPTSFLANATDVYNSEEGQQETQAAAPQMFNPAQFQNQNIPNYGLN